MLTTSPSEPAVGSTLHLAFPCCDTVPPARLVERDGSVLVISAPLHACGAAGSTAELLWFAAGQRWKAPITYRQSAIWPRPQWRVTIDGPPVTQERSAERIPEVRMIRLWVGPHMVAARMFDRSERGLGCTVALHEALQPGDDVEVDLGEDVARIPARVVRAVPSGRSLNVGLALR
jgi:hypothetical protein